MWLTFAIISSVLLGFYDLTKKASLKDNAFIPVLFLSTTVAAAIFGVVVILSRLGIFANDTLLYVPQITKEEHLLFFIKSVIVGSSWFLAYMGMTYLPITIVVPIRATGPFWVIIGALILFDERFSLIQWIGILVVLIFFYIFSLAGKKEGVKFRKNKWIYAIIGATIIGAISGLYDKFLLFDHHRMAVQAWFSIYMVLVMLPFLMLLWYPKRKTTVPFKWRLTIPAIAIVLSLADFFYFYALSQPEALIGVVSLIRRGSVVIAFSLGAVIFKEGNIKRKSIALAGILVGIVLLILGS